MASVQDAYVGVGEEGAYGTPIAPTKFYEFLSEGLRGTYERIESEAHRAGARVLRSDRFQPVPKGAEGDLKLEVLNKGFGLWLKHMLGTVTTSGAGPTYTHTAKIGDLAGKSLTVQAGRVDAAGTLHPFTYEGGKVKSWELANAVDSTLTLNLDLDFEAEKIGAGAGAYAVAVPTYPTDAFLLTFTGGSVSIGGTDFKVSDITIKGDNNLKIDRWFLGNTKKEPKTEGLVEITFELTGEFEGLTHLNRVSSLTSAGAHAEIIAQWASPVAGHSLAVTLAAARFDDGPVNSDGAKLVEHKLTGKAMFDVSDSGEAISAVYTTSDATP